MELIYDAFLLCKEENLQGHHTKNTGKYDRSIHEGCALIYVANNESLWDQKHNREKY